MPLVQFCSRSVKSVILFFNSLMLDWKVGKSVMKMIISPKVTVEKHTVPIYTDDDASMLLCATELSAKYIHSIIDNRIFATKKAKSELRLYIHVSVVAYD